MRPILRQIATLIGDGLREGLAPLRSKTAALEARVAALEGKAGIPTQSRGAPRIVRSAEMPHEASAHTVGDVVRVAGGEDWRCVGPNRWRKVA